jgi:hypothetical protein
MTGPAARSWDSLPPDVLERVDALYERFEAAWKAGTPPALPEYLAAAPARAAGPGARLADAATQRQAELAGQDCNGSARTGSLLLRA